MHFFVAVILIFAENSGSHFLLHLFCFASVQVVKNLPANTGDTGDVGSIPGPGRSPGGGNGNSLQYSCLENPMDRWVWRATVSGVAKSQMCLNDWAQAQSTVMCVSTQNLRCDKKHGKTQITKEFLVDNLTTIKMDVKKMSQYDEVVLQLKILLLGRILRRVFIHPDFRVGY